MYPLIQRFQGFLHQLAEGPPDPTPVAWEGGELITWGSLRARVAEQRRARGYGVMVRRRVLLDETRPLDFLVRLLAALADDDVPVIPPNFQAHSLAGLARLPSPAGLPPQTLELYTSGSTGEPKCVAKQVHQLEAECRVLEAGWGDSLGNATMLATTPHHHIYGLLFRLLWPLAAGRPLDGEMLAQPAQLSEGLRRYPATVLVSSPAQLCRLPELIDLAAIPRPPLRVFSSGGPLPAETAEIFARAWGTAPVEILGSTETGGIAWRSQGEGPAPWTPMPEVSVGAAEDGALLVRSPFLPDARPQRIEDLTDILPDGRFLLRGRLDRIVKIEEKRLSLPEMEGHLVSHPEVAAAAVVPISLGRRTVLGVVIVPKGETGERRERVARLKEFLRQRYEGVLLPRRWRFVPHLPYSDRGKLRLDELLRLLEASR